MFCATGPGNANWEPSVPSFIYGFLRARQDDPTGKDPLFMIEVDSLEDIGRQIEAVTADRLLHVANEVLDPGALTVLRFK